MELVHSDRKSYVVYGASRITEFILCIIHTYYFAIAIHEWTSAVARVYCSVCLKHINTIANSC